MAIGLWMLAENRLITGYGFRLKMNLFYFRPGEEARMLARCQFGVQSNGKCGATFTYPIKGYPWRRNIVKSYDFIISKENQEILLSEVYRIMREFPAECLNIDQLWNDSSEKANGITRDRKTNTLCYTIGTHKDNCDWENNFSIRENSKALVDSELFKIISDLIKPYETL